MNRSVSKGPAICRVLGLIALSLPCFTTAQCLGLQRSPHSMANVRAYSISRLPIPCLCAAFATQTLAR